MNPSPSLEHLLDQTLTVLRASTTLDDAGSSVVTWPTHLADLKARVEPERGQLSTIQGRETSTQKFTVYVAGHPDIQAGDRLAWKNRVLLVQGVVNVASQNKLLVIDAQEVH